MNPDNQPNQTNNSNQSILHNKVFLIAIGVVFLILIIVAIVISTPINPAVKSTTQQTVNTEAHYLPGITDVYTDKSDSNLTTIFNGRNFIKYNITTKQADQLLPQDMNLPQISNLKWSNNGDSIAFKAQNYSPADDLGKILKSKNLNLNNNYYWIYNISRKAYTLIDEDGPAIENVFWSSTDQDTAYYTKSERNFDSGGNWPTIVYQITTDGQNRKNIYASRNPINYFTKMKSGDYYSLEGNGKTYDVIKTEPSQKKSKITDINTNIFAISPDQSKFYGFVENPSDGSEEEGSTDVPGTLNIYNISDGKIIQSIKNENLSYLYTWSNDTSFIYTYYIKDGKAVLRAQDVNRNAETILTTDNAATDLIKIIPTAKNWQFFYASTKGLGFVSPDNIVKPYTGQLDSIKTQNFSQGYIIGIQNDNKVRINITNNPISTYTDKALGYIKSKSINPLLINYTIDTTSAEEKSP